VNKYNIFTVLNEGYADFGRMFVYSIFDSLDLNLINNVFLYDTGLEESTKKDLQFCDKIKIVDTGLKTKYSKIHDKDWEDNVYSKARLLRHCINNQENFLPTAMIDCDSIFVREFQDVWNKDHDMVACRRSPRGRAPGHISNSSHIGSFFAVNNRQNSLKFLDSWVLEISNINPKDQNNNYIARESPALSNTIDLYKNDLDIGEISEHVIANIETSPPKEARIFHLKSDYGLTTIESRISQPRSKYYARRYLKQE